MTTESSSGEISNPLVEDNTMLDCDVDDETDSMKGSRVRSSSYQTYRILKQCQSLQEAKQLLETGQLDGSKWRARTKTETKQGDKHWYRCAVENCPRKLAIILHPDSLNEVTIVIGDKDHVHEGAGAPKNRGIPADCKEKIIELEGMNLGPKAILQQLHLQGLFEPEEQQLNNFLKNYRNKYKKGGDLSLNDLKQWCDSRAALPDNIDQVFVPCSEFRGLPRKLFRIFLTTRRLLGLTQHTQHVLADATYKLDYEEFPVLTVGTTDRHRSFHPYGIAVCHDEQEDDFVFLFQSIKTACALIGLEFNPTILIADNAAAITNGFSSVFTLEKRINCWAHVDRNIDKQLKSHVYSSIYHSIYADIYQLQACFSPEVFRIASKLFISKWSKNTIAAPFIDYMKAQWIDSNSGWYEGFAQGLPSTSNAIESTHRVMKNQGKLRNRLKLIRLLDCLETHLLPTWTYEQDPANPNCRHFYNLPKIEPKDWKDAYEWQLENKKVVKVDGEYYVQSEKSTFSEFNKQACREYEARIKRADWESFDDYVSYLLSVHRVRINEDEWKLSTCTCVSWSKKYHCKHVIDVASRLKLADFEEYAMNAPLGRKIKRGRPSARVCALRRQPPSFQAAITLDSEKDLAAPPPPTQRKKRRNEPFEDEPSSKRPAPETDRVTRSRSKAKNAQRQ